MLREREPDYRQNQSQEETNTSEDNPSHISRQGRLSHKLNKRVVPPIIESKPDSYRGLPGTEDTPQTEYRASLEAKIQTLNQQVEITQSEKYALQEQLQIREAEVHDRETEIRNLTNHLTNYERFTNSQTERIASLEAKIQNLDQQMQVTRSENREFQRQLQLKDTEIHNQKIQLATFDLSLMPHDEKVSFAKELAKMYIEGDLNRDLLVKAGQFFPHEFLEDAIQRIFQAFQSGQKIDGNIVTVLFQNGKLPLIVDVDRVVADDNAGRFRLPRLSRAKMPELQDRETAIELLARSNLPTSLMQISEALRMIKKRVAGFIFTVIGGRQSQPRRPPDSYDGLLEIEVITHTPGLLIYCQNKLLWSGESKLSTPTSPVRLRTPTSPSVGKVLPAEYIVGVKSGRDPINWFDGEFLIRLPPDQEAPINMSTLI